MTYTSNIDSIIARMEKIPQRIEKKIALLVRQLIIEIDQSVHEKTPVWSGLAVRNMIWTTGQPNRSEFPAIKQGSLEGEGRRAANESAARQTRDAVLKFKKPYGVFWLSNAANHIVDLEAGKLPSPQRSRVPPGGMFGLTYAQVRAGIGV